MTQAQASVNQRPLPAAARVFEKDPESALAAAAPLGSASLRPAWSPGNELGAARHPGRFTGPVVVAAG
jgi:hypothetical protein